jgi:ribosomal-protein-alanine N-acetyltransferase
MQPGATPLLRTERMVLRPLSSRDAAKLGIDAPVAEILLAEAAGGRALLWLLAPSAREPGFGWIGLRAIDALHGRALLDGLLLPEQRRQGRMTEAAQRVLSYGFTDMQLNRVGARLDPQDAAGIALVKKLGFQEEGRLRGYRRSGDGGLRDVLLFSRLAGDSAP